MLHVEGGEQVKARCLLIATGAEYRKLGVPGCERFEGCGVYYAATPMEAQMCRGSEVVVVGGGNSAGQAAVYLAGQVRKVYLVIRGNDLYEHMSSYLADRIRDTPNIEVLLNTEVAAMHGEGYLGAVEVVNRKTGEKRTIQTPALFSFIGAVPRTDWLPGEIERDEKGFILTGTALGWTAAGPTAGVRSCWRPVSPACSPRATCDPGLSSGLRRPSARGRWPSSSCTSSSRRSRS